MKKSVKLARRRNVVASSLATPLFQQRIVKDKSKFTRKLKHKNNSI